MFFFNRIRLDRVLNILRGCDKKALLKYDDHKREDAGTEEKYAYYHGQSLGYKYAIEQVRRRDITNEKKVELLFDYKTEFEEGDIRAVCIFLNLHRKNKEVDQLPVRGSFYGGKADEAFKKGFKKAMDRAYKLFNDSMHYMTFLELLFSKR